VRDYAEPGQSPVTGEYPSHPLPWTTLRTGEHDYECGLFPEQSLIQHSGAECWTRRRRKRDTSVLDRRWADSPPAGTTHQSPLTAKYEYDYECEYEGIFGAVRAHSP
jgi:hypothetical protein